MTQQLETAVVPGRLLARTSYNPGPNFTTYTTTSSAFADMDATNLTVTFVAPASGSVVVRLRAVAFISGGAATYFWGVACAAFASGADQPGFVNNNPSQSTRSTVDIPLSGLTPGTSYTFRWRHAVSANTGNTYTGGTTGVAGASQAMGPAVMEVVAA